MQVEVYGGLSAATKRRLREIAEAVRGERSIPGLAGSGIKPGTKLIRAIRTRPYRPGGDGGSKWKVPHILTLDHRQVITGTNLERLDLLRPEGSHALERAERPGRFKRPPAGVEGKRMAAPSIERFDPPSGGKATCVVRPARVRQLAAPSTTRKSSEEGLEQDFNSLHAQREASESYIKSQKPRGWNPLPATYDDGGYSGGTMERPGLQKLLAAIQSGMIDVWSYIK